MDFDRLRILKIVTELQDRVSVLESEKRATQEALAHWRREADRDSGEIHRLREELTEARFELSYADAPCSRSAALLVSLLSIMARMNLHTSPRVHAMADDLDLAIKRFESPK